ncbi:acyl-CoA N-acyltransferase [Gongronella butleri]|nr:acyl-CoA N-acyltransferase [Gongronella butleri]
MTLPSERYVLRQGTEADDDVLATNYFRLYMAMGFKESDMMDDWKEYTLKKIAHSRTSQEGKSFVVTDTQDGNKIVASGMAHLFSWDSLHPHIFKPTAVRQGYIWAIFVEPEHRRHGLATKIVQACNAYFKEIGCTDSRLFASDTGRLVYERIGFTQVDKFCVDMMMSLDNK